MSSEVNIAAARTTAGAADIQNSTPGSSSKRKIRQRFFREKAEDTAPLRLTHDRIYILPSKRGWMFLFSLLLMLIASINYSLSLGYALSFMLTGLFCASLLATYRNVSNLVIKQIDQNNAAVGDPVNFKLMFDNDRKQACQQVSLRTKATQETPELLAALSVASGETEATILSPIAQQRGWLELGRITISSDFPVGLWVTWGYFHIHARALVWPKLENNPPHLPGSASNGASEQEPQTQASTSSTYSNQGEFAHLRDYRAGDTPSAIAWKSLARGAGLMTKEFEESQFSTRVSLRWEDSQAAGDLELRLSRLAAWCNVLQQENKTWELILPSITLPSGYGEQHFVACMQALALFGLPDPLQQGAAGRAKKSASHPKPEQTSDQALGKALS